MRTLIVLFIAIAVASCGTFKKHKTKEEQKAITKVDSSALVVTQSVRKVDTSITVKGSNQYATKPVDNIVKGGDSLVLDNEQQRVVVDYDPTTGNLRAKGTVKDRQERVQVQEVVTKAEQSEKRVEAKQESDKQQTDIVRENDGFAWGVALTMIGILMLIVIILLMLNRSVR